MTRIDAERAAQLGPKSLAAQSIGALIEGPLSIMGKSPRSLDRKVQMGRQLPIGRKMTDATSASIALRLRRVTYEDAYIAVPVTDAIMMQQPDGSFGIDFERLVAEGIRIGADARVEWKVESFATEAHPVQKPRPDDRMSIDPLET